MRHRTDAAGPLRAAMPLGPLRPGESVVAAGRRLHDMSDVSTRPLRILHAVRAPVGGIIRHILDLANGQAMLGHAVGIVADNLTGGERADAAFHEIAPRMKLGVHRLPIRRQPHPSDLMILAQFNRLAARLKPDVFHGHGAKAGVFVRLRPASAATIRIYTPHGGSLHYAPDTLEGLIYLKLEQLLMNRTELFLFESAFARDTYRRRIGSPQGLVRCVFNGVAAAEFDPIELEADATDVVYVGEFRHIKGADLLVDAIGRLRAAGKPLTLTLAGDGEETAAIRAQVERLKLGDAVRFIGHVKARSGFAKGRLLVVPSRGDSMPYVVIEAAAAGVPMIAANVGGIPEIFGPFGSALFPASNAAAMADAIAAAIAAPEATRARAGELRERIARNFSQTSMVEGVMAGYREAFAKR